MKILLVCLSLWSAAWAQDEDDDLGENTVTGVSIPETPTGEGLAEMLANQERSYEQLTQAAAEQLQISLDLADAGRKVCELIYQRRYSEARTLLDEVAVKYPTTGWGPLGVSLIYQALMFENYDYRYEKQYELSIAGAKKQLEKGLAEPGNDALDNFLMAATLGVDAIHSMRKTEYVSALNKAYDALKHLDQTKKLAPTFVDAQLGDGLYNYWRSVISMQSKAIPDAGDKRAEGLEQMKKVEKEGVFLAPAASLALAYSYVEQRQLKNAMDRCLYLRLKYPDNVINNMTLGRIYTSMRRYEDALRVYDEIIADASSNQRVYYHRGVVLARMARYDEALKSYETYVGFKDVPTEYLGQTYYRLGALYVRQKDNAKAKTYFEQAVTLSDNQAAKNALARLEKSEASP